MKLFAAVLILCSLAMCFSWPVVNNNLDGLVAVDADVQGDANIDHIRLARHHHGGRGYGGYGGYGDYGGGYGGGYPYGGYGGGYPGGGGYGGGDSYASASASSSAYGGGYGGYGR